MTDELPRFTLTINNYRCFDRSQPAVVELGPGFIAFVGPNNSGKSTLLRMFYELRGVFQFFRDDNDAVPYMLQHGRDLSLKGADDPEEVFPFANSDDILIDFGLSDSSATECSNVAFSATRPCHWRAVLRTKSAALPANGFSWDGQKRRLSQGSDAQAGQLFGLIETLGRALYVGPFRNAINRGQGTYFDLEIGTGFVKLWDEWKNGPTKSYHAAVNMITEDIARIFGLKRLEINPSVDKQTLKVVVDGRTNDLREVGAGLAQFIVTFACAAIRNPSLILIDEPELNLHPSLQVDFLTSLAKYSQHSAVWFATHSMGLARTVADRIYSVRKRDEISIVKDFDATSDYAEFVGEMSFSAYRELGFERILLVEGPSDVRAVQQWLRLYKKDHKIVFIHLGGSSSINGKSAQELAQIKRISDKVSVLIDSERSGPDEQLEEGRDRFLADCKALGIEAHATQRRALENYLTDAAIQAVKGEKYRALRPHELLKDANPAWAKRENWRIAACMTLDDLKETDLHAFFSAL